MRLGSLLGDGARRIARAPIVVLAVAIGAGVLSAAWPDTVLSDVASLVASGSLLPAGPTAPSGWFEAVLHTLGWSFLAGGLLERLACDRTLGARAFLGACVTYFGRFLRLGFVVLPVAAALSVVMARAAERGLVVQLLFFLGLVWVTVVLDYARIRLVVEDRRSVVGAVVASHRFVRRHALTVLGVWLTGMASLLVPVLLRAWSGDAVWLHAGSVMVGKLFFYATSIALFQQALASHGFVARHRVTSPPSAPPLH